MSNVHNYWQAQRGHALKLPMGLPPEPPTGPPGRSRVGSTGLSEGTQKGAVLGTRLTPTTGGALERSKRLAYPIPGE